MKGIKPHYEVKTKKLNSADKTALRKIYKERLADSFVSKKSIYNDSLKKGFMDYLNKKNVSISQKTANMLLKRAVYKYKKQPLFDLEFDVQLKAAVAKLQ